MQCVAKINQDWSQVTFVTLVERMYTTGALYACT